MTTKNAHQQICRFILFHSLSLQCIALIKFIVVVKIIKQILICF